MSKKQTQVALAGAFKIPKHIQDRLVDKMLEKNDEKIIDKIQQLNAHKESVKRLSAEIEELCSLNIVD